MVELLYREIRVPYSVSPPLFPYPDHTSGHPSQLNVPPNRRHKKQEGDETDNSKGNDNDHGVTTDTPPLPTDAEVSLGTEVTEPFTIEEPIGTKEPLGAVGAEEPEERSNGGGHPRAAVPRRASPAHRQRSVVRALRLLEELVDETETKGTGGLKGHGARVRGAKMVLKFESKVWFGVVRCSVGAFFTPKNRCFLFSRILYLSRDLLISGWRWRGYDV